MSDDLGAARARKRHNEMLLDRIRGVPAMARTPETDADPNNPNVTSTAMSEAEKKAREVARPLNVVEWLTERADNCAKIAHSKSGADAVGWLVDEAYFRAAVAALLQLRRDTIEECARVADKYAQTPVGNDRQDTAEAFAMGLTYQTGGADNALAIRDAIRKLAQD